MLFKAVDLIPASVESYIYLLNKEFFMLYKVAENSDVSKWEKSMWRICKDPLQFVGWLSLWFFTNLHTLIPSRSQPHRLYQHVIRSPNTILSFPSCCPRVKKSILGVLPPKQLLTKCYLSCAKRYSSILAQATSEDNWFCNGNI